ncbi:MAG: autotransporter outer membrane beta-barrel domain-containing protein [Hyphomonadaceae bacterium]
MRITRLQLAGLAALLSGAAFPAFAQTTVSTATTTPLDTNTSGDITVATGGSITVDAGETAITVNSNNSVLIDGSLASNDADNTIGILIDALVSGNIEQSGTISLLETYARTDADSDGNPDGAWASGTNRHGIFLADTFTGDIIGDGAISVEGNNSSGITFASLLDGDLDYSGAITVIGDNSYGVHIGGGLGNGVTGDVVLRGNLASRGENAMGLLIDAPVGGEVRLNGSWVVTGFSYAIRPSETAIAALDADDLLEAGPAVAIRYSVDGGVTVEGIGVENDDDDDGDGETGDADDNVSAGIESYGPGAAVLIEADASANLVLGGALAPGEYGFVNRGQLRADGVYDNIDAYGLQVRGTGGSTATIVGGVVNDGGINVSAAEANAYGIFAGEDSIIDEVLNRGTINGLVISQGADQVYGVYIDPNASVSEVNNTGRIRAVLLGETGDAYAIYDGAGTVTSVTNTGSIQAQIVRADTDPITGSAVAIDLSNALGAVTIDQTPDVPFTDDDADDDDVLSRPEVLIQGDIRLSGFGDTVNLLAGSIVGDIAFDNGADIFNIDGGATFRGFVTDTDSDLALTVTDGTFEILGGTVGMTTGQFGADSMLIVHLDGTPATMNFSGAVNFDDGAAIVPVVPVGLPASGSHTFLTAGSLTGAGFVTGPVTGDGVSWLYNVSINDLGNALEAEYLRKTAAQLGLNSPQSAALDPILAALQLDADAALAMAGLDNEADFFNAYEDLMPYYASGATEMAATAIQQMQSATTNRLSTTRLHDLNEVSVWAQEIGYGIDREPASNQGLNFRGQGFGLAGGIDGPLDNGGLFGLSVSFLASEVEEPGRPEGELSSAFGQVNAYLGTASGPFDLDFVAGVGAGRMNSRRFVEIGTTYNALTEADWWAFEGHGAARASLPLRMTDWLVFTPQAALTYVGISEQGYTEEGGGVAIDYEVDGAFSQRLWADVGVEFSGRLALGGRGSYFAPRLYLGYRANALDDATDRDVRFVSTGTQFTVADDGLGDGGPLVGIGIDATNGYSTFSLSYEGEFGDQIERHSVNAAVRFRF